MKHILKTIAITSGFLLVGTLLGCGSDLPEIGEVTGTVTLDGKPVKDAKVIYSSDHARTSYGKTDDEGKYELTYIRNIKGAAIGSHTVSITTGGEEDEDEEQPNEEKEGNTGNGPDGGDTKMKAETIPAKYNSKTTLTAEVKPGDNTIDFTLKK